MSYGYGNQQRSLLSRFVPLLIALVLAGAFLFHGCEEGPFGRHRVVALAPEQEAALGAQAFRETLSQASVDRDPAVNEAVGRVVRNLVRATGDPGFLRQVNLEAHEFEWKWSVVRSHEVNAFCLPGGKMVVYTGILPVAYTEAGLAVVMGHEISHALARHGSERMAQQRAVDIVRLGTIASFSDMDYRTQQGVMQAFNMGSQFGLLLPYSRNHESEADHMGLLLMSAAGYDPANAPKFWQRMTEMSAGRSPPEFASTHPGHERRVAQLEEWQAEARVLYRSATPAVDADRPLPLP
ncbi:MAG: M48 family metallopeptidase [Gemmataceae bacterium]